MLTVLQTADQFSTLPMLPITRILAPVDFSERCLRMMPYVRAIAQRKHRAKLFFSMS